MLTKSELDLLPNLRLSPPTNSQPFDVIKELERVIAVLQGPDADTLNGDQVTILVLQALVDLLTKTTATSSTLPLMTGFDPPGAWPDAPGEAGRACDQLGESPIGLTMDYDSAYADEAKYRATIKNSG